MWIFCVISSPWKQKDIESIIEQLFKKKIVLADFYFILLLSFLL